MFRQEKNAALIVCGMIVAAAVVFASAVCLLYKLCILYVPRIIAMLRAGNKKAIADYIRSKSRVKGAVILWVLFALQFMLMVIPLIPLQIVAGMTYGTAVGTLISVSSCVCSSMVIFFAAQRFGSFIQPLMKKTPKFRNWIETICKSDNRLVYTITAFMTPGFPNGIIPMRAANSDMSWKEYLISSLIGMPLPAILTCLSGSLAMDGKIGYSIVSMGALFLADFIILKNRDTIAAKLSAGIKR